MKENSSRKSVISGLFWKFGERLLTQGVAFVISVVLARILAPEDYGTIALVNVFISLASVFITSGFATALIQKKDADSTDFSTIFFCSLGCSALIYAVLYLAAPFVAAFYGVPVLKSVLQVYALQIPLSVYHSVQVAYVSRHMQFKKAFVSSGITCVLSGVVGIAMALAGKGVWALIAQSMSSTVINTVIMMRLIPWRPEWKFSAPSAKKMMQYGSRLLAADLSGTFFNEIRSLIVGKLYTSADLAYYNKGHQVPHMLTGNLINVLQSVMFPAMANHSDDLPQLKQLVRRSMRVMAYVMLPCMVGLSAVMEPLILLLFTEKWAETIPYGQLLSIGLGFSLLGSFSLQTMKAIGRSDVVLKLELVKKPVYLLTILLGVSHSVMGLAVSAVVYDFYALLVNQWQMKKYIHYSMKEQLQDLLPAAFLSMVMAGAVWILPTVESLIVTLLAKVLLGIVVYVLGSALLRLESFWYLCNLLRSYMPKSKVR